jgi:serine/threonine protein kinase
LRRVSSGDTITVSDKTFAVSDHLGEGGFGTVDRCVCVTDGPDKGRPFCVKRSFGSTTAMETARLEFDALRGVEQHENVVRVFACDFGPRGDGTEMQSSIVEELIEGHNLARVIREGTRCSPHPHALSIARQILAGLRHLHSSTPVVVHRDLKPANIMVEAKTGRAVLVDFGASILVSGIKTTTGGSAMLPRFTIDVSCFNLFAHSGIRFTPPSPRCSKPA